MAGHRDRVCISIATKDKICAATVQWLLGAFVQLAPSVEVQIISDRRPLQHARNVQRQRFLASRCTHMFILDADCIPQVRTIQKLLAYGLPIIAAPHPSVKGDEMGLMVLDRSPEGYVQHRPLTGLQGPDVVVGCAGLLIQREVLEKLGPFRCLYDAEGLLVRTEDFDFCDRAHEAGYDVWADCNLVQGHIVELTI